VVEGEHMIMRACMVWVMELEKFKQPYKVTCVIDDAIVRA
jgi:hypothetical protein